MTEMQDIWSTQEVPPPLAKFEQDREYAPENEEILAGAEDFRILDKQQLKRAQLLLSKLDKAMGKKPDKLLSERQTLIQEFNDLKIQAYALRERHEQVPDDEKRLVDDEIDVLKQNVLSIRADIDRVNSLLQPYRRHIIRRDKIRARLVEHQTALEDDRLNRVLTQRMAKEANYFAEIIIRTWNQLGYCFDYTVKNKHRRKSVRFESIVATPDSLQFKIYVSRMGLFAGVLNMLPNGVHVSKLIEEDTLYQLTSACERPVKCMNIADNPEKPDFSNGVWLEIDRTGVTDGLLNRVLYKHVMARYDVDCRHLIPLPMGVKRGRHINWANLTSHPHLLIAGQTGSGKSNVINVIIATLISNYSPDEIRLVLIDLKEGVELMRYEKSPHLLGNVITNIEDTVDVMHRMEALRRQRMMDIRKIASDIDGYNALVPEHRRIPRIMIVFDEYGALQINKELGKTVYDYTAQIAMKARAAGIHLVIGAQTPYNDIVPNKVKSNITFVIAGRQRTLGSSISTFGDKSATKLAKIPGRMICDDGVDTFQVQLPYISHQEIETAIETAMNYQPGREITNSEIETIHHTLPNLFGENEFIQIIIEHFEGVVSPPKVHEFTDGEVGLRRLRDIAAAIRDKDTITYNDETYLVKPYGKGKKLEKTENTTSDSVVSDVFSNVNSENERIA